MLQLLSDFFSCFNDFWAKNVVTQPDLFRFWLYLHPIGQKSVKKGNIAKTIIGLWPQFL